MSSSGAELIIAYIDELARGRSRIDSAIGGFREEALKGLAGTILSAIVRAQTPPTVPQIGRSLGYPRQTVQRHVDALVRDGAAGWIDNPDHKVARRLVPTARGQALYDRANATSTDWAEGFAAGFDTRDLRHMVATMRAIRRKLEEDARKRGANED